MRKEGEASSAKRKNLPIAKKIEVSLPLGIFLSAMVLALIGNWLDPPCRDFLPVVVMSTLALALALFVLRSVYRKRR